MSEIYGFWHIATIGEYWELIVQEQLDLLSESGLINASEQVFACVVGSEEKPESISNVEIIDRTLDVNLNELFTLQYLKQFCDTKPNCKVWYIHTKGVSHPDIYQYYWRKYMEYFNIERWKDCVAALNEYDICGVEWTGVDSHKCKETWGFVYPNGFLGNFWWANSNYIRKLDANVAGYGHRGRAEFEFISSRNPKVKCFHNSWANFGHEIYPRKMYATESE